MVNRRAEGLAPAFVAAARELVADGVDGITTNCGFLSLFQAELAAAAEVPVAASSLMQVGMVARLLPPGRRVGVLTISAASLSPEHLEAAGVPPGTPVGGVDPDGAFATTILGDRPSSTSTRRGRRTSRRRARWSTPIPTSARWCSNAPT